MMKGMSAAACAVAMGWCTPAWSQDPGVCTSKAYKQEADDRGRCIQTDPRARQQCVERIVGVRERAVANCLRHQNDRVDAASARAAEARAAAAQRQIEAQRNARPN